MNKKQQSQTNDGPTDFEIRAMAVKLAVQHSRNCHVTTLIKLADSIYGFLKGNKYKSSSDE